MPARSYLKFLLLMALFCAPWLVQAMENTPEFKTLVGDWKYGRERKTVTGSNRVTANFNLKNNSAAALEDVEIELTYFSGIGEKVFDPIKQTVGTLKSGEGKVVAVAKEFVPIFSAYQIVVTYKGGREVWWSNSDVNCPEPKIEKAQSGTAGVQVMGEESGEDATGIYSGKVRVRNIGTLEATGVKVTVTFFAQQNNKKVKIGDWSGPLGNGKLKGSADETIPFKLPTRPPKGYSTVSVSVTCDEVAMEQQLSGGDFTNSKDLEAAQWSFKRVGAKGEDLEVSGKLRNGLTNGVEAVRLNMDFIAVDKKVEKTVKSHAQELPGVIKPGEIKAFTFTIQGVPKYDTYQQSLEFATCSADGPKKEEFKNKKDVEVILTDFFPKEDGSVSVVGATRNGKEIPVKDIKITVHLKQKDGTDKAVAEKLVEGPLAPGEVANFVVKIPEGKDYAFASHEFTLTEIKPAK